MMIYRYLPSILLLGLFLHFNSGTAQSCERFEISSVSFTKSKTGGDISTAGALHRSLWGTVAPMTAGIILAASGVDVTSGTVLFATLFWGGALVGPAWGYFYANAAGRGLRGILFRSPVFTLASVLSPTKDFNDGIFTNPDSDNLGIWILAGLVIVISDIYDIARVG